MPDEVKWIKLSVGILDDEKIIAIEGMPEGNTLCWMWVKLLALAGKQNRNGEIMLTDEIPYTDTQLATRFRLPITTIQLGLITFQKYGMIEIIDNIIHTTNWSKYQDVEALEILKRKKEKDRLRKQEARAKARLEPQQETNLLPSSNTQGFAHEDDLLRIQEEHNQVLDSAERAGFPKTEATWNKLIEFYGEFGLETVLEGINACTMAGKPVLNYLRACCRNSKQKQKEAEQSKNGPRYDDQGREIWDEY